MVAKIRKRALVLGATGLVGRYCLEELLNNDLFSKVVVLTRRALPIQHEKLSIEVINFDQYALNNELLKVDYVFCCLGTTIRKAGSQTVFRTVDYHYPLDFARATDAMGKPSFILISALGANPHSRFFYNRVKGEVEQAIAELKLKALIILRPSLLTGDRNEYRFGEKFGAIIMQLLKPLFRGPIRKYRPIAAETVACAMVHYAEKDLLGINIFESDQIAVEQKQPKIPV